MHTYKVGSVFLSLSLCSRASTELPRPHTDGWGKGKQTIADKQTSFPSTDAVLDAALGGSSRRCHCSVLRKLEGVRNTFLSFFAERNPERRKYVKVLL